jgi:hypothetical protein
MYPLRRELYPKHMAFFGGAEGARARAIAANRVGKTEGMGGYELTCSPHRATTRPGGRASDSQRPVRAWAAGNTGQSVKEILQEKLLGPEGGVRHGAAAARSSSTGLEAREAGRGRTRSSIAVKHKSGGWSRLVFKSYDQKRISFEGTEQDVILLDEEPPLDIFSECLLRTMTTDGGS